MTLSRHTLLLKLGITVAACATAGILIVSRMTLGLCKEFVERAAETGRRAGFPFLAGLLPPPAPYAAYLTIIAAAFYALAALILLFYFFEKTQSIEARFFMFFVFSFVFETLRAALPLSVLLNLPGEYIGLSAHTLVFFRYFGIFSLFCASLYSAGLKTEKEENIIFPLIVITLFISFRLPVNQFTWDTSLYLVNGYPSAFTLLEAAVSLLTVLSFFAGAARRATREYRWVGAGAFLVIVGRAALFYSDTYIQPVLGALPLIAGTYLICAYLRKIYLWV
jgi:hypothetical protein